MPVRNRQRIGNTTGIHCGASSLDGGEKLKLHFKLCDRFTVFITVCCVTQVSSSEKRQVAADIEILHASMFETPLRVEVFLEGKGRRFCLNQSALLSRYKYIVYETGSGLGHSVYVIVHNRG